jgi:ADP-heptose:LPS heptosyltransferase
VSSELLGSVADELARYERSAMSRSGAKDDVPEMPKDPLRLSYRVAASLHVHPRERQRLLEMLGVAAGPPRTRLVVTPDERERAEHALRSRGAIPGLPRVALVLSVGNPVREWPVERFAELALALAGDGAVVIAAANPGDEERVERLRTLAPGVLAVPTADLRVLLALLAACDVLVSGDTGPAHIATALGVPRVTIYGPTNPAAWNPGLPTTRIVRDPSVGILPTKAWGSAGDRPGLTGVTADEVLAHVRELLARGGVMHHAPARERGRAGA